MVSSSLWPHGLPARLLRPWNSPGKNTGVGCHFLLQGIFPAQGSNSCLRHWQEDSLPLCHLGADWSGRKEFIQGDWHSHRVTTSWKHMRHTSPAPLSTLASLPAPPPHRSTLPRGESSQSVLPVFPTKTMSTGSTAEALQESKRPESAQWRPATWTQGGKWTEDWTIRRVRVPRTHSQREVLGSKCRGSASRRGQDSSPGFTWSDCLILGLASWKLVREAPLHDGLISMLKSTGKQQSPTLSTLVRCSGVLCNLRVSVANDHN